MTVATMLRHNLDLGALSPTFRGRSPFDHVTIEDFFRPDVAAQLAADFPAFDSDIWREYSNAIEAKKVCNHFDRFPPTTYKVVRFLNSRAFISQLEELLGTGETLYADPGLHGGGWHTHKTGGRLNAHVDYSIHPKLGLERRLNLIIYLTPEWKAEWGGALGLWKGNEEQPTEFVKEVDCLYNRAVIFDTSQNSWHGLPTPLTCPEGVTRNSLALYYLCAPREGASSRSRAQFVPSADQAADPEVLELIAKRNSQGGVFAK